MAENPYAAPTADIAQPVSGDHAKAQALREKHLSHETNIKSIGLLYCLGGVMLFAGMLIAVVIGFPELMADSEGLVIGGVYLGVMLLGGAQIWAGLSLRRLNPVSKIPITIFSVIGLVGFPIGTLISLFVLYLLYSVKGRFILGPEYPAIVEMTPHVKRKTSVIVWVLLALLIVVFAGAIFVPMFAN